jgi:hypothetical protein
MNRNSALIFPGSLVATPGSIPWINPGTRQIEWIPVPVRRVSSGSVGVRPDWLAYDSGIERRHYCQRRGGRGTPGHLRPGHVSRDERRRKHSHANNIIFGQAGKKHRLLMVFKTPAILSSAAATLTFSLPGAAMR